MKKGMHPNSRANLVPIPPGMSGNPGGRPKGVTYPCEYLRSLGGLTEGELRQVRKDRKAPINQRMAAEVLLQSITSQSDRLRREAFGEIADRTTGRPTQSTTVHVDTGPSPQELVQQIRQQLTGDVGQQDVPVSMPLPMPMPVSMPDSD